MPTAVTEVAAVWRFAVERRARGSADGLFDDEQHAHERHHGERSRRDAHDDHGRDQAQGRQDATKPRKPHPSYGFTTVCCVRVHDVEHYLRMPGLCSSASDGVW